MGEPEAKRQKGGDSAVGDKYVLYSYWRSSCSWRVRIALAIKGIDYEYKAVNLLKKDQLSEDFLKLNPMGQVPALVTPDGVLTQSPAILEYLEEKHPFPALLPAGSFEKARVRQLCDTVGTGIQPVQNLSVLVKISQKFGEEHKMPWGKTIITEGFVALEAMLQGTAGKHCYGDAVTMADLFLVPQVYNANRFGVEMDAFPTIVKCHAALAELPEFKKAIPDNQPDAVKA